MGGGGGGGGGGSRGGTEGQRRERRGAQCYPHLCTVVWQFPVYCGSGRSSAV